MDIDISAHCTELNTGLGLTGNITLNNTQILLNIYGYNKNFSIDFEQAINIITENSNHISLHLNFLNLSSESPPHEIAHQTVYKQQFISNIALIGHNHWADNDKLKQVQFTVKNTKSILRHTNKIKAIGQSKIPSQENFLLLDETANGMRLRASYGASYGMDFESPSDFWPSFEIEFENAKTIHEYIFFVSNYVDFLSFCLGVQLKPTNIRIDRLSRDEMMAALEARKYNGNHEVRYVWPETSIDSYDLWAGGSPVLAFDDSELAAFGACLLQWMDRAPIWRKSYALMRASLALKSVVSSERLMSACRWFEEIPLTGSQNALSDDDIHAIASAATAKATELGCDTEISRRIENAIKWLKLESNRSCPIAWCS